jgi:hypothetical protein
MGLYFMTYMIRLSSQFPSFLGSSIVVIGEFVQSIWNIKDYFLDSVVVIGEFVQSIWNIKDYFLDSVIVIGEFVQSIWNIKDYFLDSDWNTEITYIKSCSHEVAKQKSGVIYRFHLTV